MDNKELAEKVNQCLNTDLPFNSDFVEIVSAYYEAAIDIRDDWYNYHDSVELEQGLEELIDALGEIVPSTYTGEQ